jgi:hypothetical protein
LGTDNAYAFFGFCRWLPLSFYELGWTRKVGRFVIQCCDELCFWWDLTGSAVTARNYGELSKITFEFLLFSYLTRYSLGVGEVIS